MGVGVEGEAGAEAEATEEIEVEVTEVKVETVGRLISLFLQREEEAQSRNQIAVSSLETDLLILLISILTPCDDTQVLGSLGKNKFLH